MYRLYTTYYINLLLGYVQLKLNLCKSTHMY